MMSPEMPHQHYKSTKASPSGANRSAPSAILAFFFALAFIRVGMLLSSSSGQRSENEWFATALPGIVETGILSDELKEIEQMLVPFGHGMSEGVEKAAWAENLMAEQQRLESRVKASKFAQDRSAKGVTAWGRELMKLQDRFEERMGPRGKLLPTTVYPHSLHTESPNNMSSVSASHTLESDSTVSADSNAWWATTFPGADQAWADHEKTMRILESRKMIRQQSRLEKHIGSQETENLLKVFDARDEMQVQRLKDRYWAHGLPGETQAETDHAKWVRDFETRKGTRQQRRAELQNFAQVTKDGFAEFSQTRKEAQVQRRKELQNFAQVTKDGFAEFSQTRKETQMQRRKGRTWALDLPGSKQAITDHEKRMQEVKSRKGARQTKRHERRKFAQITKDGFAAFFEARRADRIWARGLPGSKQAVADHDGKIKELETRKLARQQARLELRNFAQVTKDGFAEFFQSRKELQAQRRQDQTWARGLPGASQAHAEHAQRMEHFGFQKQRRSQRRASAQTSKAMLQNWTQGLTGAKQAHANHEQTMRELEVRKVIRQQHRLETVAPKTIQNSRQRNMTWAQGMPGSSQAHTNHEKMMQEIDMRKMARQQRRKNPNWPHNLPGANQAYIEHEQRMLNFEDRKQARQNSRRA